MYRSAGPSSRGAAVAGTVSPPAATAIRPATATRRLVLLVISGCSWGGGRVRRERAGGTLGGARGQRTKPSGPPQDAAGRPPPYPRVSGGGLGEAAPAACPTPRASPGH